MITLNDSKITNDGYLDENLTPFSLDASFFGNESKFLRDNKNPNLTMMKVKQNSESLLLL